MCLRCRKVEDELVEFVEKHAHECGAKEKGDVCAIPLATMNYRESVWWLLALTHSTFDVTMDRMDKARDLFDKPQDIPSQVLKEWEEHAQRAAELLGRARYAREAIERGSCDSRVQ
jgi:hypothetical protein